MGRGGWPNPKLRSGRVPDLVWLNTKNRLGVSRGRKCACVTINGPINAQIEQIQPIGYQHSFSYIYRRRFVVSPVFFRCCFCCFSIYLRITHTCMYILTQFTNILVSVQYKTGKSRAHQIEYSSTEKILNSTIIFRVIYIRTQRERAIKQQH